MQNTLKSLTFECAWLPWCCLPDCPKEYILLRIKKVWFNFWQVHFGVLAVNQLCFFAGFGLLYLFLRRYAVFSFATISSSSYFDSSILLTMTGIISTAQSIWRPLANVMKMAAQPSSHIGGVLQRRAKLIREVKTPGLHGFKLKGRGRGLPTLQSQGSI